MASVCEMMSSVGAIQGDLSVRYARCGKRAAFRVRRYGRLIDLCATHKLKWFNSADVVAQL